MKGKATYGDVELNATMTIAEANALVEIMNAVVTDNTTFASGSLHGRVAIGIRAMLEMPFHEDE